MKTIHRVISTAAAAAVLGALFVPSASACGYSPQSQAAAGLRPLLANAQNPLESASPAALTREVRGLSATPASIVGMWSYQFIAKGNPTLAPPLPDGTVVDFGYSQWHSDGTELTNSGGRAPAIQNFCMGVWVQTGTYTYVLNHYAFTYDLSGNYTGPANIAESVTLSPGGTKYSGTFTLTLFDTTGKQIQQINGQITADRVTVDTAP